MTYEGVAHRTAAEQAEVVEDLHWYLFLRKHEVEAEKAQRRKDFLLRFFVIMVYLSSAALVLWGLQGLYGETKGGD